MAGEAASELSLQIERQVGLAAEPNPEVDSEDSGSKRAR